MVALRTKLELPPELDSKTESHALLRKYKASLEKRFSLTRMDALYSGVRLAWFLVALDRADEAQAITHFLQSNVTFAANHNIWSPIGAAICLEARLLRIHGDGEQRKKLIARLLEHPAFAVVSRAAIAEWLEEPAKEIQSAETEKSQKWALEKLTTALMRACYFRETSEDGFYYYGWYGVAPLENVIERGLRLLRDRLN